MKHMKIAPLLLVGLFFITLATGCFYRSPVRHLASDVCLVTPDLTRKDVVALLGPPDHQRVDPEQGEVWSYFEVKKSTLRKTPYIGEKFGLETYDLITITFAGDRVFTCLYRLLSEDEFQQTGLKPNDAFEE